MHRLIVFIFFVLITGGGLYFIAPVWMERQHQQAKLDQVNQDVLRNERIAANYDKAKTDLQSNPAAAVRVAREKFGFSREGERVYIFDDEEAYRKSNKE
jgi:hypothetical protein